MILNVISSCRLKRPNTFYGDILYDLNFYSMGSIICIVIASSSTQWVWHWYSFSTLLAQKVPLPFLYIWSSSSPSSTYEVPLPLTLHVKFPFPSVYSWSPPYQEFQDFLVEKNNISAKRYIKCFCCGHLIGKKQYNF